MQAMDVISDGHSPDVNKKKKRIRRRMVNGVLVSNTKNADSSLKSMEEDDTIKDIGEDCQ